MTPAPATPLPSRGSYLPIPGSGRSPIDRHLLRVAVAVAVVLHVGALGLPLPERSVEPPEEPSVPAITIVDIDWKPPPLEERPVTDAAPRSDRVIPVEIPEDLYPDRHPLDQDTSEMISEDDPARVEPLLVPGAPPPVTGPLDEWTPDLILPVPLPDRPKPEYPSIAIQARIEGRVILRAVIDEEGRVTSIRLLQAPEPDLGFSRAAIDAVSRWRYRPGTHAGRPVAVRLTVAVDFYLE
jgi:protein TonB